MRYKTNMGYIELSSTLLAERLGLPEGCHIRGIFWDFRIQSLIIYLEGDMLPEAFEGEAVQRVELESLINNYMEGM